MPCWRGEWARRVNITVFLYRTIMMRYACAVWLYYKHSFSDSCLYFSEHIRTTQLLYNTCGPKNDTRARSLYNLYLHLYTLVGLVGIAIGTQHKFVRSLVRSFARSLVRSLARSLVRSFARSFARSLARSLVRSFARSLVRSFARSLVRSFARSLVRSFARSLVRSFATEMQPLVARCHCAVNLCIFVARGQLSRSVNPSRIILRSDFHH